MSTLYIIYILQKEIYMYINFYIFIFYIFLIKIILHAYIKERVKFYEFLTISICI